MLALSWKAANRMFSKGYIEEENIPVYQYGLFWLFNIMEFLLLSVITGLIFNVLWGNLAFFAGFMLLRIFGGGYHANTEIKCQLSSAAIFTLSAYALKYINSPTVMLLMLSAELFFSIFIICFSPVDFSGQELSPEEKSVYNKLSRVICVILIILSVIFMIIRFDKVFAGCSMALTLQGVLLILGLIANFSKSKKTIK